MLEIAAALTALDLDQVLTSAMAKITAALGAERTTLFLVDHAREEIWSRVGLGPGRTEIRLPVGEGLPGYVARTGETLNVLDAYDDKRFHARADRDTGFRTRAVLATPIRGHDGGVVAVAEAVNKPGGFTAEDEQFLLSIGPLIGLSLGNTQLYSEVRRQNDTLTDGRLQLERKVAEVDLLFGIEREISAAESLESMLGVVLTRIRQTFRCGSVAVLLIDDELPELHWIGGTGLALQSTKLPRRRPEGVLGRVLASEKPVRVGPGDQREDGLAALTGAVGNLLGVKLTVQARGGVRRTVGVLELADPESRTFTAEDADLVSVVAPQLGRAVQLGRTRAENERHGRLAALGQMLGGIVHDLSSPMSVISGYAELMARENDASARERYRGQVIGELDHVNVMIREVLAFLRGDSQLLVRRNLLPPFFEELTASLQRELQPHQVSLEVALEYSGAARFDAGKLKRLLTNLARNTGQSLVNGGHFRIRCGADGDTLMLRVWDDGPGLPASVVSRLFSPFNSAGKAGGTGLGLALVKQIVDGHGGTIICTTGKGEGTTFDLRFPRAVVP